MKKQTLTKNVPLVITPIIVTVLWATSFVHDVILEKFIPATQSLGVLTDERSKPDGNVTT